MMKEDPYSQQGEFYDVLCPRIWEHRKVYLDILTGLTDVDGAVMDIAAGSGHGVLAIAQAIPGVEIYAVEPSAVMRAMLLSRVMNSEDLQKRVTVIPSSFEDFTIPGKVRAAMLLACIGLFEESSRKQFWGKLASHMPSGGIVLFDVMVDKPMVIEKMIASEGHVGRHTYTAFVEGLPYGEREQKWISTYQVKRDKELIQETHAEYIWHTVSLEDIANEAASHGFTFKQVPADPRIPSGMLCKL